MANFEKIGQTIGETWQFIDISRWWPSAILSLLGMNLDQQQSGLGGLNCYAQTLAAIDAEVVLMIHV